MSKLYLRLLGGFALRFGDRKVALANRKARALLAYLALNPDPAHSRDKLAGMLWSGAATDQARNNLRQCLFDLRRSLRGVGESRIVWSDQESVGMDVAAIEVDVLQLRRMEASKSPPAEENVVDLCAGELLLDIAVGEEAFDEWLNQERRAAASLIRIALIRQAEHCLARSEASSAVPQAQRLLALDNLDEEAHRLLMRVHLAAGHRHAAIQQYEHCARILKAELGVEPEAATTALYRSIRSGEDRPTLPARGAAHGADGQGVNGARWLPGDLALPEKPAIAVLPFDDFNQAHPQECFAAGFAADIINALARYRWFFVSSRSSSFTYPSKGVDLRAVSRELGVRYVLEGSVRRAGNGLRLTCQLVDGTANSVAWADRFDFAACDLFRLQDEITHSVASCIAAEIMAAEHRRALAKPPNGLDAWGCYHLAGWHMRKHSKDSNARAQELLARAIDLDPYFSPSFARMSRVRLAQVLHGLIPDPEAALDHAQAAAETAIRLDRHDAHGHEAAARAYLRRHEHGRALEMARAAVELNPSLARAHYALGNVLYFSGCPKEAIAPTHRAVRLSPRDPAMWAFLSLLARCHLSMCQYQEAEIWARRAISQPVNGYGTAQPALAAALAQLGRTDEARRSLNEYRVRNPNFGIAEFRGFYRHMRDPAQLDHFIEGLRKAGMAP